MIVPKASYHAALVLRWQGLSLLLCAGGCQGFRSLVAFFAIRFLSEVYERRHEFLPGWAILLLHVSINRYWSDHYACGELQCQQQ